MSGSREHTSSLEGLASEELVELMRRRDIVRETVRLMELRPNELDDEGLHKLERLQDRLWDLDYLVENHPG